MIDWIQGSAAQDRNWIRSDPGFSLALLQCVPAASRSGAHARWFITIKNSQWPKSKLIAWSAFVLDVLSVNDPLTTRGVLFDARTVRMRFGWSKITQENRGRSIRLLLFFFFFFLVLQMLNLQWSLNEISDSVCGVTQRRVRTGPQVKEITDTTSKVTEKTVLHLKVTRLRDT